MKEMINLNLRTEFSFKSQYTYGHLEKVIEYDNGHGVIGIADTSGTYGFADLEKVCKAKELKPIYGVKLRVLADGMERTRSASGPFYTFIAKNTEGYQEINRLTETAYKKFYYKPFLTTSDVLAVSDNVIVIAEVFLTPERIDYIALTTTTPRMMLDWDIPKIAMQNNFYPDASDKEAYEILCGARKHGADSFRYLFENQTYPMHILTTAEWYRIWKDEEAIENTFVVADQCNVKIPVAEMVKFPDKADIKAICLKGSMDKGVDIISDGEYKTRYEMEIALIEEKGYTDYFLVVSDLIRHAKKTMFVGPGRGSSAGSLVCYLMDITTVDPIVHGLVFERFIDVNRFDLPDIDIDFPDAHRQEVIKYMIKKYGKDNVCHIANINRLKAKSAIGEAAMALSVPYTETEIVKNAIVERSGGDARSRMRVQDTLESTEIGRLFLEKYPMMKFAFPLEAHATHAGKHAGGIIVCNEEITKYCGMNAREDMIMMNKKGAEVYNLLKIDVLGLRTLTILQQSAALAGFDFRDFYEMPLDLERIWPVFNEMRLSGIFQFEGQAMMMLCKEMGVYNFNDVVALTALARPGPLHSGGANTFVKRRIGVEPIEYASEHPLYVEETRDTYGVIIYQEQLMNICRKLGQMTWAEVSDIRRATSKSLGKEFFGRYEESYLKGTRDHGIPDSEAKDIWESMMTFGSYAMNKSHTVSYGLISYYCAFMKSYYPLEFAAATMNNIKNESAALKMLRDMSENDGIEYIDVDPDESDVNWTIKNGKLVGGLVNITGIAEKSAKAIIKARNAGEPLTTGQYAKLISGKTPYGILYPTRHWWGDYYENPWRYGLGGAPSEIIEVEDQGDYVFIGKVLKKDLRDLNEFNELMKRGGKVLTKNDKFLRVVVEDDTSQILCKINRFDFESLDGAHWAEILVPDVTWVIIRGTIRGGGWRVVDIKAMAILEEIEYHGENNLVQEKRHGTSKVLGDRVGL